MDRHKILLDAASVEAAPFEIPGASGEFRIQILNEDAKLGVVTSVVHLPAGGRIPAHRHEAGEEMHYVLEGDLIEAGKTLGAGAFLTHPKGVVHGPHESRGGAKVLTVQSWQSEGGEFDFHPAEENGAKKADEADLAGAKPGAPAATGDKPAGGAVSEQDKAAPPGGMGPADGAPAPGTAGAATQEEAAAERGEAKGYS